MPIKIGVCHFRFMIAARSLGFGFPATKKSLGITRMKTMFCLKMVKTDFGSIPLGSKRVMCQINL